MAGVSAAGVHTLTDRRASEAKKRRPFQMLMGESKNRESFGEEKQKEEEKVELFMFIHDCLSVCLVGLECQ